MSSDAPTISDLRHQSPWTTREKIGRALWGIVQGTVFYYSPHNAYAWRAFLLRTFGAKLGRNVRIRRSVSITVPWHLEIDDNSSVGDHAILYNLGTIRLGKFVTVSQYAHLCAGTHDASNRKMVLLRPPIIVGDDAWIAADAYVGPGVTIGARTILGARSNAFKDLPSDVIAVGSPARPIKPREFSAQ